MATVTSWGHHTDLFTTCGLFWVLWPFAWPTLNSQNISFLLVSAWPLSDSGGRRRSKSRTRTVRAEAEPGARTHLLTPGQWLPCQKRRREQNNDTENGRSYSPTDSLRCWEIAQPKRG